MTFLPIAARELRVESRNKWTFRLRLWVAGGTTLLLSALAGIFHTAAGGGGPTPGQLLFQASWGLSFGAAALSGVFLTADCLSDEKREGTLGLLFLTDLRGHDIVLGKLTTRSLQAAYAFLAAFPMVGICFLLGGVTASEFVRVILALGNALMLSLGAGMLISTLSRDATRAMTATFLLMVFITGGLPMIDALVSLARGVPFRPITSWFSPVMPLIEAGVRTSGTYWTHMLCVAGSALAMLATASVLLPGAWQDRARGPSAPAAASRPIRHRPLLDADPVNWLASRGRWSTVATWLALGIGLVTVAIKGWLTMRSAPSTATPAGPSAAMEQMLTLVGGLVAFLLRLWLVIEACRFWFEAKANGALELILVTPLRMRDLIMAQSRALQRRFLVPLLVLLALMTTVELLELRQTIAWQRVAMAAPGSNMNAAQIEESIRSMRRMQLVAMAGSTLTQITTFVALAWFSVWMAMTSRRLHIAVAKTLFFADLLPAIVLSLLQFAIFLGFGALWQFSAWLSSLAIPVVVCVLATAVDLALARMARSAAYRRGPSFATGLPEREVVDSPR